MRSKAMEGLIEFVERRTRRTHTAVPDAIRLPEAVFGVSAKGEIRAVLQAPEAAGSDLLGATIDSVWPSVVTDRMRIEIREVLRSRTVRSEQLRVADDPSHYELICIPQGPDRAILVFRILSDRQSAAGLKGNSLDATTTLPTRDFLYSELQHIIETQRLREGRAALICINIGQLDDVGRSFGPGQQDQIFRKLGRRLKSELRGANENDMPDFDRLSIVVRFDFRQFAVVLPSIDTGEDAESVTGRLIDLLGKPVSIAGREVQVDPRAGIALFPQDGIDPETLFDNAFAAMEIAATNDTGPYAFHSGTVNLRNLQRQDLEIGLRRGLEREEFVLNFLPVIDARSREIAGVEALLRWPEEVTGSRSVRQVVTLAERTGLILPIGEWVLKKSCQQVLDLGAAGDQELRLSINVTGQEFSRPEFARQLAATLENLDFDTSLLDIEIQENVLHRDALRGYRGCHELTDLGVGIVIDDFGIGTCSLSLLARSPVDGIKIDNSLVAGLESNERDRAACRAAIATAQNLGMRSIAEGVETACQADFLIDHGCDFLQGFFLSEPLAERDLEDLMSLTRTGKIARVWSDE